jgi:signal transduction histidine kinase/CheY-like chemotaxis protein
MSDLRSILLYASAVPHIAAIIFAVRVAVGSRRKTAWVLLSIALTIMLISRMSLLGMLHQSNSAAATAAIISTLFFCAMYYVRSAFIERERAEASLAIGRQRLELAMRAAPIGLWHWDLPSDQLMWDDSVREHFWVAPGGAVTSDMFYQRIHPHDRDAVRRAIDSSIHQGRAYDIEYRTVAPADLAQFKWIRAIGRVTFEQGHATRFNGITLDVTDRKAADNEREQLLDSERFARREAEQANRLKDEFLSTVSHELRTPLNAIFGWAQLLKSGKADAGDIREGLAVIERNARIQTQIIEDLLDMSRIISGNMRLDVQRIDLPGVLQAAVDSVRPAANAKGIRLRQVIDPAAAVFNGDPGRLQQVVWNLLSNAIKFTPPGGEVELSARRAESHLDITVTDSGEGIAPEFIPHLFERFRQADSSASRTHGGLGLGLSIVRHLVEMHGGTVRAHSDGLGQGARFVVSLPSASVQSDPGEGSQFPAAYSGGLAPSLKGVRVLVVDDEADSRDLVRVVLEKCEASVVTAASGAEALEELDRQSSDVLVSDIGMPGLDGYQLIRAIRQRGNGMPAAALTAFARSDDRRRAMLAGYQLHVAKPFDPSELVAIVANLAARKM